MKVIHLARLVALASWFAACGPATRDGTPGGPQPPTPAAPYMRSEGLQGAVTAAFSLRRDVRAEGAFWQLPFPSETRRGDDGRIVWRDFPGYDSFILGSGMEDVETEVDGFSVSPVVYFHFSGPIDQAALPAPGPSASPSSPVALVDVDPASPLRGERIPLAFRYYPTALAYIPANTLAIQPLPGFVLRPATTYAAIVSRALGDANHALLGTPLDMELVKWTVSRPDPLEERARLAHAPAFEELERQGLSRADVAAVAVFRTLDPHRTLTALVEAAGDLAPAYRPRLVSAEWLPDDGLAPYGIIQGYYCTPSFQRDVDRAPYTDRGGTLVRDANGRPEPVPIPPNSRYATPECGPMLRARFVLTVPRGPAPPAGFPLVVAAHGTTGDARSFLGNDDFAGWAAMEGLAAASTDQPLHGGRDERGARPGSREEPTFRILGIPIPLPIGGRGSEMMFYNALRPAVIAGNLHQAAADTALLMRLLAATDFATATGSGGTTLLAGAGQRPGPRFDGSRLILAGHSQGSQSAAILGAVDPLVRGVVLSGAGGNGRIGTVRRSDIPARPVLEGLVGLRPGELDEYHPFVAIAQTMIDSVDPQSYAPLYAEPPAGRAPRSVLLFEGTTDSMNVPEVSEVLATALGATPLEPVLRPVPALALRGVSPAVTVSGNAAGGRATLALVQLASTHREDGHFVMYRERAGGELVTQFFRAIARGDSAPQIGPVPPP